MQRPVCKVIPANATLDVVTLQCPNDVECLDAAEDGELDRCNNTVFFCNVTEDWRPSSEEKDALKQDKDALRDLCPCNNDRSREGGDTTEEEESEEEPEAAEAADGEEEEEEEDSDESEEDSGSRSGRGRRRNGGGGGGVGRRRN